MKIKMSLIAVLALIVAGSFPLFAQTNAPSTNQAVLYYTCPMHPSVKSDKPGSCPLCGMNLEPVYADATNSMPSAADKGAPANIANPTPYPLKTCVVSGEKLGEMGEPIVFVYTNNGVNQEIKFCCPMCKTKFLKDPDKYVKIIKHAESTK
jgi:Heavy metal binding domain